MFIVGMVAIIYALKAIPENFNFYIVMLLGITCNVVVVAANRFRMPVVIQDDFKRHVGRLDTRNHFPVLYEKRKSIRFWYLSDIFRLQIPFAKDKVHHLQFSVGDVLLVFSLFAQFVNLVGVTLR